MHVRLRIFFFVPTLNKIKFYEMLVLSVCIFGCLFVDVSETWNFHEASFIVMTFQTTNVELFSHNKNNNMADARR